MCPILELFHNIQINNTRQQKHQHHQQQHNNKNKQQHKQLTVKNNIQKRWFIPFYSQTLFYQ